MSEAHMKKIEDDLMTAELSRASQLSVENKALRDERDRLITEYVRLFRLGEPIAKMLSELSILPIGCSREQELAWKMAVKNFRHYQRDYAADVLLQAAMTPARGQMCMDCGRPVNDHQHIKGGDGE